MSPHLVKKTLGRLTAAPSWAKSVARQPAGEVMTMSLLDQAGPHIVDGLVLMRAIVKIANAADRRKVIELAAALARSASPPISAPC
jgi:hypothetical protein